MKHELIIRVYHEDTDSFGIVYHSNYLNFMERGRTEWLRELGLCQVELREQHDLLFVVHSAEVKYLKPARFNDLLRVESEIVGLKKASVKFSQKVFRENELLVSGTLVIASTSCDGRLVRIPSGVLDLLVES